MWAYKNKLRDDEPNSLTNRHVNIYACVKCVRLMAASSSLALQESDSWLHSGAGWGCIPVVHWGINECTEDKPAGTTHTHTWRYLRHGSMKPTALTVTKHNLCWNKPVETMSTCVLVIGSPEKPPRVGCVVGSIATIYPFGVISPSTVLFFTPRNQCLGSRQVRVRNVPWLPSCRTTMGATAWSYRW
jgi:hypothetical protein